MIFAVQKEELIARLDAPMNYRKFVNSTEILESNKLDVKDLLEVSFHKKKEIAFRAAWMLECVMTQSPAAFSLIIPQLLALLPKQNNPSAMRHYTKIVALLTARNANRVYKDFAEGIDFDPVIEALFAWLIDAKTLVATKVHCMQALANLAPRYTWIKDDLLETIEYLIDIESIAFFARAKMVKKQLMKMK
jgi:hypothetical protein